MAKKDEAARAIHHEHPNERHCSNFQRAVELVGRRWNGAILFAASRGASRYREFLASIPGLSERLLAQRLRELEEAELVSRTVSPTVPVQVRYSLTNRGQELIDAMQPLADWSERWPNP